MLTRNFNFSFQKQRRGTRKSGQSLVEFSVTLPILLLILASTLEVANVLMMLNRVQLAAREGARFGAMGDEAGVLQVVQDTSQDSLIVADDRMVVWQARPILDTSGAWSWKDDTGATVPADWGSTMKCMYPTTCTEAAPILPQDIIDDMKDASTESYLSGDRFVIVIVKYDTDLILNLPWFSRDGGRFPMSAYAIMRQEVDQTAVTQRRSGCSAFPIALDFSRIPGGNSAREGTAISNVLLNNAGGGSINGFSFLGWNINRMGADDIHKTSTNCDNTFLYDGALRYPGNSLDPICGYENPNEPGDKTLHRGEWVPASPVTVTGQVEGVMTNANHGGDHIGLERALRIIVYKNRPAPTTEEPLPNPSYYDDGTNAFYIYQVYRFAVVRVTGLQLGGPGTGYLNFEFVRWDDSCGQN